MNIKNQHLPYHTKYNEFSKFALCVVTDDLKWEMYCLWLSAIANNKCSLLCAHKSDHDLMNQRLMYLREMDSPTTMHIGS